MNEFGKFESKETQEFFYSEFIESVLNVLKIEDVDFVEKYKKDQQVIDRVKKAEDVMRKMNKRHSQYKLFSWKGCYVAAEFVLQEVLKKQDIYSVLKEKLEGEILVDLGCGRCTIEGPVIASESKASLYVGVDKYYTKSTDFFEKQFMSFKSNLMTLAQNTAIEFIFQDMLMFVAALPDDSVNFMMNGIDKAIIPDEQYWSEMENQIRRTLKPGGVVIVSGGEPNFNEYAKEEFGYKNISPLRKLIEIFELKKDK